MFGKNKKIKDLESRIDSLSKENRDIEKRLRKLESPPNYKLGEDIGHMKVVEIEWLERYSPLHIKYNSKENRYYVSESNWLYRVFDNKNHTMMELHESELDELKDALTKKS